MIKIGITACFLYPDPERAFFGPKTLSYLENDMAKYISREGVLPVLIPDLEDNLLFEILSYLDGFIFQGGADLAPESYGEQPIGKWKGDIVRDNYELKIMDFAVKNRKPILGICRGCQLMNVYFDGTLYQDTYTQIPEAMHHRDADLYDNVHHEVLFSKGKLLDNLYKSKEPQYVNSVHHQAIKKLGNGLEILATSADDGIIEAIGYINEKPGKIMGVQWHPEFSKTLKDKVVDADILYHHFLEHLKSGLKESS